MPGKLPSNLRRGQLAEDLGVYFLRTFCAVADVRREDDFGIDAIATLLRSERKVKYAEESFGVQIKAASVGEIPYSGQEVDWLMRQNIPFFILTVNLNSSEFKIYTTNPVFSLYVVPRKEYRSVILDLTQAPSKQSSYKMEGDVARVYLQSPITISSIKELQDDGHLLKLYQTLKMWLIGEIGQFGFRTLSKARIARWETWDKPDYYGTVSHGSVENLRRDLQISEPYLSYLSNHLANHKFNNHKKLESAFLTLKDWFDKNGVQNDIQTKLFE